MLRLRSVYKKNLLENRLYWNTHFIRNVNQNRETKSIRKNGIDKGWFFSKNIDDCINSVSKQDWITIGKQ